MNRLLLFLLVVFSLLWSSHSFGKILRITHIHEAQASLKSADVDTLVLFDIDRTLIIMSDQALRSGKSGFLKRIKTYPSYASLSQEEQDRLLSIVLLKTSHQIFEKDVVEIIQHLQKNHIKTIAFSTMLTGRLGDIPSMEQWRLNVLHALGLFFQNAFPETKEIIFCPNQLNRSPTFKDGLLSTSKQTKGEVLRLFLDKINWHPKKIIMIDDQISSLESVEASLDKLGIAFQGFQYQYVEEMLKNQTFNEALITFQMNYLLKHHVWLTDEESLPLLCENK